MIKADSYAHFLERTVDISYDPSFLDDTELRTGKHRTVIALSSFIASVIPYARPSDIKKELNERFRKKHPDIHPTLTFSQIKKVKEVLITIALEENLELSSVAKAYAYFEKLILKKVVQKSNRKLMAAVCYLLSVKVNDRKETDYSKLIRVRFMLIFLTRR
jgi:hypothetical protein